MAHAGLKGFSTQKLSWGSACGTPFDIGRWIGPDGSYVAAALKPGSYTTSFSGDLSNNSSWLSKINANGAYGVYAGFGYHGYGVSIMNDCKVGWDKPNNNTLRLTLIHTPAYDYGSNGQRRQDFGKNLFKYAVYGHAGDWKNGGTVAQAARLNQPLLAFQTIKHSGVLGKSYSFMSISAPQVLVKTVKKAENSNEIIVRVQETNGASAANVQLTVGSGITSAREVNGFEDPVGSATVTGGKLQFNIGAYQPKTFALTLAGPPTTVSVPVSQTVPYVSNEQPSKAVDGSTVNNSKWCSTVTGNKWLRVDLGQIYTINRWVVKHAGAGGETTSWNTRDFRLQRSSDGSNWVDVDLVTGNTANITDRNVTLFTSRYVRLYITVPTQNTNTAARIYEFEVYGN